jgi:hypothetical protein
MRVLNSVFFALLRADRKSLLQCRKIFEEFYDDNSIYISDSQKGKDVERNYCGLMIKILTPLTAHPVEEREKIREDIMRHSKKIADHLELTIETRPTPNSDILIS